jgi:hypothetical protein
MNCDSGTATTGFEACGESFWRKSSQVPLHEALTPKIGLFKSRLIKANQGKSRYFCE